MSEQGNRHEILELIRIWIRIKEFLKEFLLEDRAKSVCRFVLM